MHFMFRNALNLYIYRIHVNCAYSINQEKINRTELY